MSSFDLNIDLGKAFGKHKINIVVEHTGLGHIVFYGKLPVVKELREEVKVDGWLIVELEDINRSLADLKLMLQRYGLEKSSQLQLDIQQLPLLKKINSFALNAGYKNISFNINELSNGANKISLAARVEFNRSGQAALNW